MKKVIVLLCVVVLLGCASGRNRADFPAIPPEPKFEKFYIYQVDGGICIDDEGMAALEKNMTALHAYQEELKKMLGDCRENR